jgi:hypothetical protein
MTARRLGASPAEWDHFAQTLALSTDLLPVVCNHGASIAPSSSLKRLGKVPSLYNRNGEAIGMIDWPLHQSSDLEIRRWAKVSDYGICIQTRLVRGIDVDVPDPVKAQCIEQFIYGCLMRRLPKRMRPNSGKFLLACRVAGDLAKEDFPVEGGIIEFLANGQQFIGIGTHESGVHYEWEGGLPTEIPELEPEEFKDLWKALQDEFAIGEVNGGVTSTRKRGQTVVMQDETADYLRASNLVLGTDRNSSLFIKCPWDSQHTSGTPGDGSTVYMPAGTNGYTQGHYKCLHAHCVGRTDKEFEDALGVVINQFQVIPPNPNGPAPLPAFTRDNRGRIYSTVSNITAAVRRSSICALDLGLDLFRDEIMKSDPGTGQWQAFTDADYTRLRISLENFGFRAISHETIRQVVCLVADENQFDSAQIWLTSQAWDGVPRVETFLIKYFGAEDTPYIRAVANYIWTAMAGRVLVPGIKADMAPILVGAQGAGKSSGVAAMVPSIEFFTEISFHEKEDDLSRRMRGRLLAEISELRGLSTKDLESVKAFVTRTQESWVPKFREFAINYLRRIFLIGTTNSDQFLADETGNRRFLPVKVGNVAVDEIRRDCAQLWAEGQEMFRLVGVRWAGVETLAKDAHEEHTIADSWEEPVSAWLLEPYELTGIKPKDRPYLLSNQVLTEALRLDAKNVTRREEMRIAKVLRGFGYVSKKIRVAERVKNVWVPNCSDLLSSELERGKAHQGFSVPSVTSVPTEIVNLR